MAALATLESAHDRLRQYVENPDGFPWRNFTLVMWDVQDACRALERTVELLQEDPLVTYSKLFVEPGFEERRREFEREMLEVHSDMGQAEGD